jgi:hypothetical protein
MSKTIEYLDRPPIGWFVLDVMKTGRDGCKRDWAALMIDMHPDEFKRCVWKKAREAFVRIPGKHRNRDAALDALEDMLATRH